MIFLLALSFLHIGTFADAVEGFSPLGRGVYLPQFDVLGNLHESGSQVCCNIRSEVIVCNITIIARKLLNIQPRSLNACKCLYPVISTADY